MCGHLHLAMCVKSNVLINQPLTFEVLVYEKLGINAKFRFLRDIRPTRGQSGRHFPPSTESVFGYTSLQYMLGTNPDKSNVCNIGLCEAPQFRAVRNFRNNYL